MKKLLNLDGKGDTIVEVIVVLAVFGLALSISYATANRSLLNARQAQENSEATAILQSQIEFLRQYASVTLPSDPHYIYTTGVTYCFDNSGNLKSPASTQAACNNIDNLYGITISYSGPASGDTFTAVATWQDVLGEGTDTVTLVYRVHSND